MRVEERVVSKRKPVGSGREVGESDVGMVGEVRDDQQMRSQHEVGV